jgi:hypothetical protein
MARSKRKVPKNLKVRGGFTPSSSRSMKSLPSFIRATARKAAEPDGTIDRLRKETEKTFSRVNINANTAVHMLPNLKVTLGQKVATDKQSAIEFSSVRKPSADAAVPGRTYVSKFHTGNRNSSLAKRLSREHGTKKIWTYDSMVNDQNSTVFRPKLQVRHGFNQKSQVFFNPEVAWWTIGELSTEMNLSLNKTDALTQQTLYAQINHMVQRFTLTNSNAYLPVVVKIHLCDFSKVNSARSQFSGCYSANAAIADQTEGRMPNQMLFSRTVDTYRVQSLVDPASSGFRSAEEGKANIKVVKTFTKKLQPNDTWIFDHYHHFGSGMNVTKLLGLIEDTDVDNNTPISYAPIFEQVGRLCEAVNDGVDGNSQSRYTGTAPGTVHFEFKRGYEKVLSPTRNRWNLPGETDTFDTEGFYIRSFANIIRPTSNTKLMNRGVGVIVQDPADTVGVGNENKVYIPVTTDTQLSTARKN